MKEFIKTPGVDLPIEFYGVQIAVVKDAPVTPVPQPTKLTYTLDANGLHFPGVDGTNLVLISNDFAADSPEVPLLFLAADKGKINLAGIVIHSSLDPNWGFDVSQKHWATLMSQVTGLKNIPTPVNGSTRKLVKPSNGSIDSTIPEQSAGVDLIIAKANLCSAAKPLVVFMGGQSSDLANAYLKDKTIADKVILFHINGYWDGGTDGYNTQDAWATYILIKRMKYVCVNVKFPEAGKYWYTGKNLGLMQSIIDSLPSHPTTTLLKNWFRDFYTREGLADAPSILWFFNNKLWKNAVKKRENGTITTGDDYDFIFITEHDWLGYGATLINKMKEFIGVPVIDVPIGGISSGFEEAINTASPGKTVVFNKGDYQLPYLSVKPGVSIDFGGSIIRPIVQANDRPFLSLESASRVAGDQAIKNGTIEAGNVYSALIANNRDRLNISLNVRATRFNGVWLNNSADSRIYGGAYHNAGWSSSQYLSGAINIKGVTNLVIEDNLFTSDGAAEGTGIEALWKYPDNPNVITNLKILRNTFKLDHRNPWNNNQSKNFSIELHNTDYRGLEIAYNNIGNEVSLASHRGSGGVKTLIHDNYGDLGGDTYFLELVGSDFEVYNNKMSNTGMFAVNFQKNGVWTAWNIYNNELTNAAPTPSWGGLILVGPDGITNSKLGPNKFPSGRELVKYMGTRGGIMITGVNQVQ